MSGQLVCVKVNNSTLLYQNVIYNNMAYILQYTQNAIL